MARAIVSASPNETVFGGRAVKHFPVRIVCFALSILSCNALSAHEAGKSRPGNWWLNPCELALTTNFSFPHMLDQHFTSGDGSENNPQNQMAFFVMMAAMIELHGVDVKIAQDSEFFALRIEPNEKSKMNRVAKRVLEEYGADIAISPAPILKSKAGGIMTHWDPNGKRRPVVYIGTRSGFTLLGAPMKDTTLLHELRHLKMHADLLNGKSRSLYGEVIAKKGRVPDRFNPKFDVYHTYLSFDEVKTYHTQIKEQLILLRAAMKASHAAVSVHPQMERLENLLNVAVIVTGRAVTAAELFKRIHTELPQTVKFTRDASDRYVLAEAEVNYQDSELKMRLPLVELTDETFERRWEIYDAQVEKLNETSRTAFVQFGQFHKALGELKTLLKEKPNYRPGDPDTALDEKLAKLDEMQRLLPLLRM